MGYIDDRHSSPMPMNTAAAASPDPAPLRLPSPAGPPPGQAEIVPVDATRGETPPENTQPATGTPPATAPAESPRPVGTSQPPAFGSAGPQPAPGKSLPIAAPKRT